jgi:cation transport ATPase
MYCSACGNLLSAEAKFCNVCGNQTGNCSTYQPDTGRLTSLGTFCKAICGFRLLDAALSFALFMILVDAAADTFDLIQFFIWIPVAVWLAYRSFPGKSVAVYDEKKIASGITTNITVSIIGVLFFGYDLITFGMDGHDIFAYTGTIIILLILLTDATILVLSVSAYKRVDKNAIKTIKIKK